jgi:hypothetical protein
MTIEKAYDIDRFYKITKNSAKCLTCNDEIESKHRHDYVSCKCGSISVDGGKDYLKRSFIDFGRLEDTSENRPYTKQELLDFIERYNKYPHKTTYDYEAIESAKYAIKYFYGED